MFWWFERGGELLRLEVLQVASDQYELRVIQSDGTENIETFASAQELNRRQEQVQRRVVDGAGKAGLVAVEMAEPRRVQGLRQGLAATATKNLLLAVDAGVQWRLAGRERLPAVEATHAPGGRRRSAPSSSTVATCRQSAISSR